MDKSKHTVTVPLLDYVEMERKITAMGTQPLIEIDLTISKNDPILRAIREVMGIQQGEVSYAGNIAARYKLFIQQREA